MIQPTDDLHLIAPVLFGNASRIALLDKPLNHAALAEQIVRQQQFREILQSLKHSRQDLVQGIALHDDKIVKERLLVIGFLQGIDFLLVQPRQVEMNRLGENLRLELSGIVGEYPHMRGQIAVDLHEAQRGEAVEPSVGRFFHRLLVAVRRHFLDERTPLFLLGSGEKATVNAARFGVSRDFRGNAIAHRLPRYTVDQLAPCPYRIFLYRILVHRTLPCSLP